MKVKPSYSKGSAARGLMTALIVAALFMVMSVPEAPSDKEDTGSSQAEFLKDCRASGEQMQPAIFYSAVDDDTPELDSLCSRKSKGLLAGTEARMPTVPYGSSFPGEKVAIPYAVPVSTTVLRL